MVVVGYSGMRAAIKASLLVLFQWYGFGTPKLSKTLNLDQWKQHIVQGHRPFRRDCRTCVLTMAGGKPHRRREGCGSSAWTMSVDLVHMPQAKDLATKRIVKYALVATALVPVLDEAAGGGGKGASIGDEGHLSIETVDANWGEGIDEDVFPLEDVENPEECGHLGNGNQQDGGDSGGEYAPTSASEDEGPKKDSRDTEPPKEEPKKHCGAENVALGPLYQKGCGDTTEPKKDFRESEPQGRTQKGLRGGRCRSWPVVSKGMR